MIYRSKAITICCGVTFMLALVGVDETMRLPLDDDVVGDIAAER